MNLYLIILAGIEKSTFSNHPVIRTIKKTGLTFNFNHFPPPEPKIALSCILTGCNPGKTGILEIDNGSVELKRIKGYEHTVLSLLQKRSCSVEYLINKVPASNEDFTCIYIRDADLLYEIFDSVETKSAVFFIIAPVLAEHSQKAVNINNYLKEKGIIKTDVNGAIRWDDSIAYHTGHGELWINLNGREPEGTVSPGSEYEEVRDALIKGLTEKLIDNEKQEPVIDKIFRREELFSGECLIEMPDLIAVLNKGYGFSNKSKEMIFDESVVMSKECISYTTGEGVVIGEKIVKNQSIKNLPIISVAPSILYYMGYSIPDWMDGKVEEKIFLRDFVSNNPPKYYNKEGASLLSEKDEASIKERLKGLGYI